MSARSATLLTGIAALAALATGCASTPTRLYTLDAIAPTTRAADDIGSQIRVDAVHVPPAWDRIELLRGSSGGEWRIDEVDHWAAPLGRLMRDTLSSDLILRLPPDRVIFPSLPKPAGAQGLRIDVLDFRADARGASLEASWVITPAAAAASTPAGTASGATVPVAAARSVLLQSPGPVEGAAATARSLAELLARLADVIVAQRNLDGASGKAAAAP